MRPILSSEERAGAWMFKPGCFAAVRRSICSWVTEMQWKLPMCAAVLSVGACVALPGERLVGTDPAGNAVEVVLIRPFEETGEPICLANSDSAQADIRIRAQPPRTAHRITMYVSAQKNSECASLTPSAVAYWKTNEEGPELCLYRPASLHEFDTGSEAPILGVWDFCSNLRAVTP
jgi:hypothetical protein